MTIPFKVWISFFICVNCIQFNKTLDVKKLLYKYVAVCGFEYLCDPQSALMPGMTTVPTLNSSETTKALCEPCDCTQFCFK